MDQKKQTLRNLVFNLISLIVNIGLGLFYTPYLVKSLGIMAYGIVPLALVINQYINVVTGSLTGSLTRFYSVAYQKKNYKEASGYISSSFAAIFAITIALVPVFTLLVHKIDKVFNIPLEYTTEAKSLFLFTIISFIMSMFSSLYNITLYSQNRLDLLNVVKIVRILFKVVFTIIFFESIKQGISFIGYANFLSELLVLILSIYYFKITVSRDVKISLGFFSKGALFGILSMTLWVIIHQVGDTGLYRIDNILVNLFWSTRESGILGALSEFGTYVMTVVAVIASLFGPLILIAYSEDDHKSVIRLTSDNSLLVGLSSALLVGLSIGFAKPIISLWLGEEYVLYKHWFILKQVTLPFYAAAGVFAFVYRAWNKVIFPALATLTIGLLNFGFSYFLCQISNGSEKFIYYMLLVAVGFIIAQSYGLNAFYFYKLYPEIGLRTPFTIFFKILLGLLLSVFLATLYTYIASPVDIIQLIFGLLIVSSVFSVTGFALFLNQRQKDFVNVYIKKGRIFLTHHFNGFINNNSGI
jgi:O-antigen/teichoic acid export membrane protein